MASELACTVSGVGVGNMLVERLWRSVKYEEVELKGMRPSLQQPIGNIGFHNHRTHRMGLKGRGVRKKCAGITAERKSSIIDERFFTYKK